MGLGNGPSWTIGRRGKCVEWRTAGSNLQLTTTGDIYNYGGVAYDSNANRYLVVYDGGSSMPWVSS
jgi:hypothetical protein